MQKTQVMHRLFEAISQFDDTKLMRCIAMGADSNRSHEVGLPRILRRQEHAFTIQPNNSLFRNY